MSDFNSYDAIEYADELYRNSREYSRMDKLHFFLDELGMTELELVEEWASECGLISSEEELSEIFDEEIAPLVIEQYGEDDEPAMNEAFNDWSDALCRDGVLHELQYEDYCYVGKYA